VNSRNKLLIVDDLQGRAMSPGSFIPGRKAGRALAQPGPIPLRPSLEARKINIDTNRLANAAEEMQSAIEKVPPEITIKFFQ
jgi:hypothetical protein